MVNEGALLDIAMPRLSDQMEEATVLQWLKAPGEAVTRGEPLVEVETDKATVVYEAEFDCVLEEIVVGDSPQWSDMPPERLQGLVQRTPIGRLVTMEEIVGASRFLLENEAINGINLVVDGGWTCM